MNIIKNILNFLFPNIFLDVFNEGKREGSCETQTKMLEERNQSYNRAKLFEIEELMDDYVICISNEWEDMLIAKVVSIDQHHSGSILPIVQDIVTGVRFLSFSILIPFRISVLEQLCKLNPYERWAYMSKQWHYLDMKEPANRPNLMTFEEYQKICYEAKVVEAPQEFSTADDNV